jgi:hypothetical protein
MKTVAVGLIGAALALALAAPAWAQAPATNAPSSTMAPSPPMQGLKTGGPTRQSGYPGPSRSPHASHAMHGKKTGGPTRHTYTTHNASGMSAAERLNAQELQTLRMSSPAAVSTAPGGNNPTSGATGPFAPW